MKKLILATAFVMGCSMYAAAQSTPVKTAVKGDQKTPKKGSATEKKTITLKSTGNNEANAPFSLPLPKHEIDTTGLPPVKNNQ